MKCNACSGKSHLLVNRITVQKLKNNAPLEGGGQVDETDETNWIQCGKEWAEFITQGSREFFRGQEIAADITHQVMIRWSSGANGYTTKMRLKMGNRLFYIASPPKNVDEKSEWIVMAVKEIK